MKHEEISLAAVKAPATFVGQALQEVSGLEALQKGVLIQKISSRGKFLKRFLTLGEDRFVLFVTTAPLAGKHTKKRFLQGGGLGCFSSKPAGETNLRYLDVADWTGLQVGVIGTRNLEQARTKNRLKGLDSVVDERRDQIVSLLFHGDKSLDFYVPDAQQLVPLVSALRHVRATYHLSKVWVSNEALLLRYIWLDMDVDRTGGINLNEFRQLLPRINLYVESPRRAFQTYLKDVKQSQASAKDEDKPVVPKNHLSYVQLMELLQQLKRQHEGHRNKETPMASDQIWDQHFGNETETVSAEDFLQNFLHPSQKMTDLTLTDAKALIETLCAMERYSLGQEPISSDQGGADQVLTKAQFEIYLFDSLNAAYDPAALHLSPDDTHSMSQYWINSSHNTYLAGDQLRSNSSVQCYLNALRRGCKCLELDCWDGAEEHDKKSKKTTFWPVIFHGHTLTSKILFRDVIVAIASYLQSNPETFPIVLSLENHCSVPFQQQMAADLEELLGDGLYIPKPEDDKELPSPRELRGKVVIKGKRPPEKDEDEDDATADEDSEEGKPQVEEADGAKGSTGEPGETGQEGNDAIGGKDGKGDNEIPEFSEALGRMTLLHGCKYKSFEESMELPAGYMHSIGESKIPKLLGTSRRKRREGAKDVQAEAWREYNTGHMTRTYPKGARVDSSNYNPMLAWAVGSQLVALNFQTSDTPLILNDGRFREQQQRGYIFKPATVMPNASRDAKAPLEEETKEQKDEERFEAFHDFVTGVPPSSDDAKILAGTSIPERWHSPETSTNNTQPMKIRLRILAGSCLPKPLGSKTGETIDPYVKVTLFDVKSEEETGKLSLDDEQRLETKTVDNNGFCPVWRDEASSTKEFIVKSPEVALLCVQLLEEDSFNADDRVAETAIPVQRLRMGYRSIQLYDLHNTRAGPFDFASLLVEIQAMELSD